MIKKILLRTYQKTSGTSRLFTTIPVPAGTIAIQLMGSSIAEDSIISEYINQKKIGTFEKRLTNSMSFPFDRIWYEYMPLDDGNINQLISLGFYGKGGEIYSFAIPFLYDIEYNSASPEGVQFYAIIETTAVRLPYVIRPVVITIPISSSILSFELKGFFRRILTLKGGTNPSGQFTIFRNNNIVYETNQVQSVFINSNLATQVNNVNDRFVCKITGITGNPTHLEIVQYVPIFLDKIGPILINPKEIIQIQSEF